MTIEELINNVRSLRSGSGVSAVREYLQAIYEDTKERMVTGDQAGVETLRVEARLIKKLYEDFGKEPDQETDQRDGAYT